VARLGLAILLVPISRFRWRRPLLRWSAASDDRVVHAGAGVAMLMLSDERGEETVR